MIRIFGYAAALAATAGGSALVARMWTDYTPAKGIWEVNAIEVDQAHLDDYLTGLKRTQVPGFEIMKKRGLIDDYKYLVRNGYSRNSPTVLIMAHFTSVSALEPNRTRDEAIEREILATLPEAEGRAAVQGYEQYRKFLDTAYFTEVTFRR